MEIRRDEDVSMSPTMENVQTGNLEMEVDRREDAAMFPMAENAVLATGVIVTKEPLLVSFLILHLKLLLRVMC